MPPTADDVARLCGNADGLAECGRRIEAMQMPRLPGLAVREGAALKIGLYPSGSVTLTDVDTAAGVRTFALWDSLSEINAVVLYVTDGDNGRFLLLQRATGRQTELPAEPRLSPDRQRLATADFCAARCVNELAVWRVTRDGVFKDQTWAPKEAWDDAAVSWKSPETLVIEYAPKGGPTGQKMERTAHRSGLDAPVTGGELRRPVRSFVLRQGRMSPAQHRAYDELLPRWGLDFASAPPDFDAVFGRRAPRVLEIGCGMGETTAAIAAARPDVDFIGVEVHAPGVGSLLKQVDALGLSNLRVIRHDAVEVVAQMIPEASLAGIHVFFPDPWPKKRHHKRRLLQPAFVAALAARLVPGGYLHAATDWEEYALEMLATFAAEPRLVNTVEGFAPRPDYRPQTKFETRGLKLGHGVFDLVFRRR